MKSIKSFVPNTITSLNLFCGCIASVAAYHSDYEKAFFMIILAGVFDFFDGMSARLLNAPSAIGKDLDSLADMVSFGFAPGMIVFSWLSQCYSDSLIPYAAFLIPVFSALRLAKFNNDSRQTSSFIGLPTPANAIFFSSLFILNQHSEACWTGLLGADVYPCCAGILDIVYKPEVVILLTVLFSLLLVSELPMFSLKAKNLKWADNQVRFLFLAISLLVFVLLGFPVFSLIILIFILISFVLWLKNRNEKSK